MGPPENPTYPPPNQERTRCQQRKRPTRRPRTRRCLLKGCENRYRPQRAWQRYCSVGCRVAARAWSGWKAQERYRATPAGQEKRRAQSRRYRERVRRRQEHTLETAEEAARVITTKFFRGFLRPAWLLREICSQPAITAAKVLLEDVPARSGARLGAGAALAGSARRARSTRNALPEYDLQGGSDERDGAPEIVLTY
jgi:hypothetical protein